MKLDSSEERALTAGRGRWLQWSALAGILLLAGLLRFRNLLYATAFIDESLNVAFGRLFLERPLSPPYAETLYWHYGWFLWPALAALADRAGGLLAVRGLTAAFGAATVLAMYGFARRLFTPRVALGAALVFALLGPAVFSSRLATYDAAALCFLGFGLWAYARAWRVQTGAAWFLAACLFFAAFLAKYVVALYFPPLVLLSLRKGRTGLLAFALPLTGFCVAYGVGFHDVLVKVHTVLDRDDRGFRATPEQLWSIYGRNRLDFWLLLVLSLGALVPAERTDEAPGARAERRRLALLLWLGTAVMFALRFTSSASDLRFFKHAAYSMFFLTPLAVEGLDRLVTRVARGASARVFAASVMVVAAVASVAGKAWRTDELVFWPDLEPVVAFLDGKIGPQQRLLVNDLGLLEYVSPPAAFRAVQGPYAFRYKGMEGGEAYARAVRECYFDHVVLVGKGLEETVLGMQRAIRPVLSECYQLRFKAVDSRQKKPIEVFERISPPAAPPRGGPRIELLSPESNSVVRTSGDAATLEGRVRGARPGWRVRIDVMTDRWYPQGEPITLGYAEGPFTYPIHLGTSCNLVVRARLFDDRERLVASSAVSVERAKPDGTAPACQ